MDGLLQHDTLHFAAPCLSARTGCAPLATHRSDGYASCLQARPALAHPAPSIRDHMKNPG